MPVASIRYSDSFAPPTLMGLRYNQLQPITRVASQALGRGTAVSYL